jgi:hypothetical protein
MLALFLFTQAPALCILVKVGIILELDLVLSTLALALYTTLKINAAPELGLCTPALARCTLMLRLASRKEVRRLIADREDLEAATMP